MVGTLRLRALHIQEYLQLAWTQVLIRPVADVSMLLCWSARVKQGLDFLVCKQAYVTALPTGVLQVVLPLDDNLPVVVLNGESFLHFRCLIFGHHLNFLLRGLFETHVIEIFFNLQVHVAEFCVFVLEMRGQRNVVSFNNLFLLIKF
jgi:hypothetical protein